MPIFSRRNCRQHELIGDLVREKMIYYPTVTREPFKHNGRITHIIENGQLFSDIGLPPLNAADRPHHAVRLARHAGGSAPAL
jgi:ferredoxin--NADP+ reductase